MILCPLVLYLLAAGGVALLARQLARSLNIQSAAYLIALPLLFTGSSLFTGRVLAPIDLSYAFAPLAGHEELLGERPPSPGILSDVHVQMLPWRAAVRHAWHEGEWPLWNPFIFGGDPLAGAAQPAPFSIVNLIAQAVPIEDEPAFCDSLTLAIAALCAFVFFAGLGLPATAALVGATGWACTSFLLFWMGWPHAQSVSLLPLVIHAARLVARNSGVRALALLAGALILLLLTGHAESVAHVTGIAAIWALFEVPWKAPRIAGRSLAIAALAAAIALGVTAFFVATEIDTIAQSQEYVLRRDLYSQMPRGRPLGEAMARLRIDWVPYAWGVAEEELSHVKEAVWLPSSAYAGGILLAPALLAAMSTRRRLALAGLALTIGGALAGCGLSPVAELLGKVPPFSLALNERLTFAGGLGLSLLAALGVTEWERCGPLGRRRALLAVAAGAGALAALALAFRADSIAAGLSEVFYRDHTILLLAPFLAVASAIALSRRPAHWVAVLLVALAVSRRIEMAPYFRPQERAAFYPVVAPLDALPPSEEPYRVAGISAALLPNMATHYRLEDPGGDEAVTLLRASQLRRQFEPDLDNYARLIFWRPLDRRLDLLGARFLLLPDRMRIPEGHRLVARGTSGLLIENPRALPRAFVPEGIWWGSDSRELLDRVPKIPDFAKVATIEPLDLEAPRHAHEKANATGTVATRRDGLGLRLETSLDRAGWIVVTETHWRGWHAISEGRELPLAYADHAYVGVLAPAGRSEISLHYRPRAFTIGLAICEVTLAGCVAAGLAAWMLGRRRKRFALSS